MSKHTAGPWKVIPKIDTGYMLFGGIAYLGNIDARLPSLENEANARLIAAAPELLEALESFVPNNVFKEDGIWFSGSKDAPASQVDDRVAKALDAIAKAKGAQA